MPAVGDGEFDPRGARPILQPHIDEFGGSERAVVGLADWLYEQGLPAYVLTYEDKCGLERYAKHPLRVVTLAAEGGGAKGRVKALRRHLKSRGTGAPALLCSGYQASLHATLAGGRGFHTLMHDTPDLFSPPENRGLMERLRITVTDGILRYGLKGGVTIVTSEFLRDDCRKCFGVKARIQRMGGLDAAGEEVARRWETGQTLRMLSVSRIEGNKRIDWLLEGLAALQRRAVMPLTAPLAEVADWRLDLVGKGSQTAALKVMAERLGIAERVRFQGFVSDEELERLYGEAHLFLMPALQGYGIPAVEALSRRLPVLLHRESGVSDVLLETPWATILSGGRGEIAEAMAKAIDGVVRGLPYETPLPVLPTEAQWAEGVSKLCGWLQRS